MNEPSPPAQSTHSPRRWLRRILLGISLLLFLIVVVGVAYWGLHQSRLNSELQYLRLQGMPTSIVELEDFYQIPSGVFDSTPLWTAAAKAVEQANLPVRGKDLPIIGAKNPPIPPPGEPWIELDAARILMQELDPVFQDIRTAAKAGGQARFPVQFSVKDPSLFPEVQALRQVVRLLCLDAHVAARDGDCERAFEDVRIVLKLPSVLQNEPLSIQQLIRIAIQAMGLGHLPKLLSSCAWDDVHLQLLQKEIAASDYQAGVIHALQGERAYALSAFDQFPLGSLNAFGKLGLLHRFELGLDALAQPWPEPLDRIEEMQRQDILDKHSGKRGLGMLGLLLSESTIEPMVKSGARAVARQRCAIIMLAVQRHHLRHGQWPASVAAIDSDLFGMTPLPAEWLLDPCDGTPLKFKETADLILIYSTGEDRQGNGGDIDLDDTSTTRPADTGYAIRKSAIP